MFHPFSRELQEAARSFNHGNFGLFFNKLIPLTDSKACKPCDLRNNSNNTAEYYLTTYKKLKEGKALKSLLEEKHEAQSTFIKSMEKSGALALTMIAELKSPLIVGMGLSHPTEIGMVLDHTLGIPYIPASSIKGIVRFAHLLGLLDNDYSNFVQKDYKGEYIDETIGGTLVPAIFGGDKKNLDDKIDKLRGQVIFLDAYPEKVPEMHLDIMNPHYGDYYMDDTGKKPPADYLAPKPIKFLTVKPGTRFIFRAVIREEKDVQSFKEHVQKAYERALEVEGTGAKTALGYGLFKISETEGVTKSDRATRGSENSVSRAREVIWDQAYLSWIPQDQTLTARPKDEGARAVLTGKEKVMEIVPESYHKKLFKKKKSVTARVTVEQLGRFCKILKVEKPM